MNIRTISLRKTRRSFFYRRQAAFSLLELMISIAIISILTLIAVPSYSKYMRRAHYTEIIQALAPIKAAVDECFQNTDDLSQCNNDQQGIPGENEFKQEKGLVGEIDVEKGAITAIPNELFGITQQDQYNLTPEASGEHLTCKSSGQSVEKGYAR